RWDGRGPTRARILRPERARGNGTGCSSARQFWPFSYSHVSHLLAPSSTHAASAGTEPVGQKVLHVHARIPFRDPLGHQPRGDRGEQDAVAEVRGRDPEPLDAGPRAEDRQAVGGPRTEAAPGAGDRQVAERRRQLDRRTEQARDPLDRKSTRLNSSHVAISYAVFCLKKKK